MSTGHATYAPSSAKVWTKCTAQAEAVAHLPEQEEGEEAAEGTRAHEELERILANGEEPDPDHPAAWAVALTVAYVRKLNPKGTLWIEQRVRLTDKIWGRCDVAHWEAETATLTIVDLKNGYSPVEADAEQLKIYAAATIMTRQLPARWIRLVVVQPNDWRPGPRIKQHVMSAADLYAFAQKAAAIPDGPKTFTAGEHCRYCPLFGRCEPTRDALTQLANVIGSDPKLMRPEQFYPFLILEKPIQDAFKSMRKEALSRATKGAELPDMKVVRTEPHRDWKPDSIPKVRAQLFAEHGIEAFDLPTPAQAAERFGIDTDTHAFRPEGGPSLAFASDRRKPFVQKSAAEMFAGVTGPKVLS